MFVSYAQNFEDVLLWRVLGHIENGFYLDIGTQGPIFDSVSRGFYEQGWRGVHVEATPRYAAQMRKDRPDEIVIEAAVNDVLGPMIFYEIPETGMSTGDLEISQTHSKNGFQSVALSVPCITLAEVFERIGGRDIHWMKIDVEGMEANVVRSWRESPQRPWVMVLESTYPRTKTPTHSEWEHMVLALGYDFAFFDGLSRYYVAHDHRSLKASFDAPANVFDCIRLYPDHAMATLSIEKYQSEAEALRQEHAKREIWFTEQRQLFEHQTQKSRHAYEQTVAKMQSDHANVVSVLEKAADSVRREFRSAQQHITVLKDAAHDYVLQRDAAVSRQNALENRLDELKAHYAAAKIELITQHEQAEGLSRALFRILRSRGWRRLQRWRFVARALGLPATPAVPALRPIPVLFSDKPDYLHRLKWGSEYIIPTGPASSVDDLMALDGDAFVTLAYVTLLGRIPDDEGRKHFCARLLHGEDKYDVLLQLRRSREGRSRHVPTDGLHHAITRYRLSRIWGLGWLHPDLRQ